MLLQSFPSRRVLPPLMMFLPLFLVLAGPLRAADCAGCARRAALVEFRNLHAPDHEKQRDKWQECMTQRLGPGSIFDPDDPELQQALEDCSSLDVGMTDYMWPSSVRTHLAESLTTRCFHLALSGGPRPPEYLFKGSFDAGMAGESDDRGREIKSRFIIELYYNGSPEELIRSWKTDSSLTDVSLQYTRMFENRDSPLLQDKPIEDILWNFERRPVSCLVDLRGNEKVKPGREVEIEIKQFQDSRGQPSRSFNRIVIQAREGRILNGIPLEADPDLKAFTVDKGSVMVQYQAPEVPESGTDLIWISNSCEILPENKSPIAETEIDTQIAEKEIMIGGGLTASIVETSSGSCFEYPFSYTVAMNFTGPMDENQGLGPALSQDRKASDQIRRLVRMASIPPELRTLAAGKEARLLSRMFPVESSMNVRGWSCSDPANDAPPPARLSGIVAEAHLRETAAEAWIIEDRLYIVHGFLDGILGFFPGWEESGNGEQPLGARVEGTWGDMGRYLEIPLERLSREKSVEISNQHSGTDGDAWNWTTSWTVTIFLE